MVGEGLPDHPADDRVVVHLLEGCVKAGREGKRARQHVGVQTPRRWMDGWMDGWIEDSIAIVDAYIASIAIRIMSDTRDEEKDRNKDQRCVARSKN